MTTQAKISVQDIDHLGIIAGIISRAHRPDLKQFVLDLICTADGDVPSFLRVADGNEVDKAVFAKLMKEFQQQWTFEKVQVLVADSALYSKDNLVLLGNLPWISRVPETVAEAKQLLQAVSAREFVASSLKGYRMAMCRSDYGGMEQRWLIVESDTRKQSEIKQLYQRLDKQQQQLEQGTAKVVPSGV
jgi:transposase